jgi:rhamnose utilization protein RhaD (predicted bifunctional aldolase and dehydrogenase)
MKPMYSADGDGSGPAALVELSRRYGAAGRYVLAGGGNTSWKNATDLYVKASGHSLDGIGPEGFVRMRAPALAAVLTADYPAESAAREAAVLADLEAAKYPGEEAKRPSVETLLHGLFPFRFVVHTHPALVNGLTCSAEGEAGVRRLFGPDPLWIPVTDPGYVLALAVKKAIDARLAAGRSFPQVVYLQNHGVFVAADSVREIDEIYAALMARLEAEVAVDPADLAPAALADPAAAAAWEAAIAAVYGLSAAVLPVATADLSRLMAAGAAEAALEYAFTPDHIVYFGYKPLYLRSPAELAAAVAAYESDDGRKPRIVVAHGLGAFACAATAKAAATARALFLDDLAIAAYTRSFGGHRFMPRANIEFIRHWEAEKYRSAVSN